MSKPTMMSRRAVVTRVGTFALAPAIGAVFSACGGGSDLETDQSRQYHRRRRKRSPPWQCAASPLKRTCVGCWEEQARYPILTPLSRLGRSMESYTH
jgi:hypothetical protein